MILLARLSVGMSSRLRQAYVAAKSINECVLRSRARQSEATAAPLVRALLQRVFPQRYSDEQELVPTEECPRGSRAGRWLCE